MWIMSNLDRETGQTIIIWPIWRSWNIGCSNSFWPVRRAFADLFLNGIIFGCNFKQIFVVRKMRLKIPSAKWLPFYSGPWCIEPSRNNIYTAFILPVIIDDNGRPYTHIQYGAAITRLIYSQLFSLILTRNRCGVSFVSLDSEFCSVLITKVRHVIL